MWCQGIYCNENAAVNTALYLILLSVALIGLGSSHLIDMKKSDRLRGRNLEYLFDGKRIKGDSFQKYRKAVLTVGINYVAFGLFYLLSSIIVVFVTVDDFISFYWTWGLAIVFGFGYFLARMVHNSLIKKVYYEIGICSHKQWVIEELNAALSKPQSYLPLLTTDEQLEESLPNDDTTKLLASHNTTLIETTEFPIT